MAEHAGKEVEVVVHFMLVVVLLHLRTAIGVVAFAPASSADEIECTVVGGERTTCISGHILRATCCTLRHISHSSFHNRPCIRINRTNHLVAVVVSLNSQVNLTLFEDRQHDLAEHRRLGVY